MRSVGQWRAIPPWTLRILLIASVCAPLLAQPSPHRQPAGSYGIEGTVLNSATGEPVQRAMMSLLELESNRTLTSVSTDAQGHFSFQGLAAGKYPLSGSKRGFRSALYDDHDGYNTAIVTGPDQDTTHLIFFLVPGSVLHGVVTADGGDPVEGARVMLFEKPHDHTADDPAVQMDATTTDDAGAYEFANIADGEYYLAVTAQPWYAMHHPAQDVPSELDVAYPVTYYDSVTEEASATPITIAKGVREQADIHLHAVPALRFAVPTMRRADGRTARPEVQQIVFGTPIYAESVGFIEALQKGSAEFDGMAPGHYEVTLGDPPRVVSLDASANSTIEPDAGTPLFPLSGTLRMANGTAPPEDAILTLRPLEGALSHTLQTAPIRNGRFELNAVAPGKWSAMVSSRGAPIQVVAVGTNSAVHAGDTITVGDHTLNAVVVAGIGSGRVDGVAQKDGKGWGGAMIVLVPKEASRTAALARRDQSDSDGSFALRDVVPGQYTVVAIEDGWKLDWASPGALDRYLLRGASVTVGYSSQTVHLPGPVAVQPR